MVIYQSYKNLKLLAINASENNISDFNISSLKELFADTINSPRLLSQITDVQSLIRALEKRNVLTPLNIEPFDFIYSALKLDSGLLFEHNAYINQERHCLPSNRYEHENNTQSSDNDSAIRSAYIRNDTGPGLTTETSVSPQHMLPERRVKEQNQRGYKNKNYLSQAEKREKITRPKQESNIHFRELRNNKPNKGFAKSNKNNLKHPKIAFNKKVRYSCLHSLFYHFDYYFTTFKRRRPINKSTNYVYLTVTVALVCDCLLEMLYYSTESILKCLCKFTELIKAITPGCLAFISLLKNVFSLLERLLLIILQEEKNNKKMNLVETMVDSEQMLAGYPRTRNYPSDEPLQYSLVGPPQQFARSYPNTMKFTPYFSSIFDCQHYVHSNKHLFQYTLNRNWNIKQLS